MLNLLNRFLFYKNTKTVNGLAAISWKTKIRIHPSSSIEINSGFFRFGFPIDINSPFPTQHGGLVKMGKNSKLIIKGNLSIAPGSSIVINDDGFLRFDGENIFAQNCFIYCNKTILFGTGTCASWNCTFMDWDGHLFIRDEKSAKAEDFYKPLTIGKNVGIQMNVSIPRGVTVGDDTIISGHTVLRKDVPASCLVYSDSELKVKHGFKSGLGNSAE